MQPQMKQNAVANVNAKTLRNRRRRQRARANAIGGNASRDFNLPANQGFVTDTSVYNRPHRALQQLARSTAYQGLSQDGMNFLKCAYAPPDFQAEKVAGVPDTFAGRSLIKKHRLTSSLKVPADRDTYILVAPTPGVAYWKMELAAGANMVASDAFTAVYYSDTTSLFGNTSNGEQVADQVTAFRYVSSGLELINTTNAMNWSGSINAFKIPLELIETRIGALGNESVSLALAGLQSINQTNADQTTMSFNMGCFSMATKTDAVFNFRELKERYYAMPITVDSGEFGRLDGLFTGLGEMESIVFKISGVTADETATIKTWACVEYKPTVGGIVYEYSKGSPQHDPLALALYNHIALNLPVAVSSFENAGMWERILNIIKQTTKMGSFVPGPVGLGFTGANMIAEALGALMF